jgi:acetylornithine/succinyldiaminopimelate/putrescine aminotransferase
LNKINKKEFAESVTEKGKYFKSALSALEKYGFCKEARGEGLLMGLPLDESVNGKEIVKRMLEKGFIINCTGHNTLRFAPPLIVSKEEIDKMVKALEEVFDAING